MTHRLRSQFSVWCESIHELKKNKNPYSLSHVPSCFFTVLIPVWGVLSSVTYFKDLIMSTTPFIFKGFLSSLNPFLNFKGIRIIKGVPIFFTYSCCIVWTLSWILKPWKVWKLFHMVYTHRISMWNFLFETFMGLKMSRMCKGFSTFFIFRGSSPEWLLHEL